MDYDGDGDEDILSGSYTGEIYLFERDDEGWAQGVFLVDANGDALVTGTSVVPELHDLDGDGDLDLVIGTRSDGAFLFRNSGSRTEPVWPAEGEALQSEDGRPIRGSNAHFADWDQDGDLDLLLGSELGQVVWHENLGSDDGYRFAGARTLVEQYRGSYQGPFDPKRPQSRVKVHVTDWNGDGLVDLLVGDVTWEWFDREPLTEDEQAEKARLDATYAELDATCDAEFERTRNAMKAGESLTADELSAFYELKAEVGRIAAERQRFAEKQHRTHGFVWLCLRESEGR